jgi:hypothetical protein
VGNLVQQLKSAVVGSYTAWVKVDRELHWIEPEQFRGVEPGFINEGKNGIL